MLFFLNIIYVFVLSFRFYTIYRYNNQNAIKKTKKKSEKKLKLVETLIIKFLVFDKQQLHLK